MATQYIQNGNFKNDFDYWSGPSDFDPSFKPYDPGQSILLPIATAITQSLQDLPGKTLRVEFDVRSAHVNVNEAPFIVSVGGFNANNVAMVSPVSGQATTDWQSFSANLYFTEDLTHCFLNVSTPRPATSNSSPETVPTLSPVRFGNFSLVESDVG